MESSTLRSLAAPLALALAIFCAPIWSAASAAAQEDQMIVRVDRVRVEPLAQKVPVLGRLVARQAGVVAARIDGPVETFHVEVGDRVEAGQVIAELNRTYLQAVRNSTAAKLAKSKAELATANAELGLARQELKRLERLKKSAAFSQARYDDARQNVAIADGKVKEAEAEVLAAEAELEIDAINLAYAEIRAPYGGVVSQRMSEAGAYLQKGAPVVRMIADRSLEIEADVPFQRLSGLEPGAQVGFTLDDGTTHSAMVRAIVPEENPLTRTRAVRFVPEFGLTTKPLAAEQSVTVYVPAGAPRDVLTVHKDAVIKRGPASLVYVVEKDTAEMRRITLGEPTGSRYEVLDGLSEGEQVVVRGNERLRPGDKVTVDGAS
jgi:RND family efflux transporter MFP subunit